ncbi:hypothetical protein [Emticicia agri]|uniref:Tetratricopeptide repeat protein n=1 Tax=Emticicia agri TaxID=2492393 RepID=A0A4Q5M042_9BACT|nr:hypothetical protein [Emticicia agri]RYU95153.1 hypothetical protein EWM59_12950 [Emticicia agri]
MKKLLLLLFFYSSISYAQIDFTRIYHPIINEAELAIVDTNYHEALAFYNEAFANVEKPFAKDYYNAAVCATIVGKMPVMFDFLEKIVAKGYQIENFRHDFFFKNVADTCKQWANFEKQAKLIKPQINTELRDSLRNIYRLITKPPVTPITAELRSYIKAHEKEQKWMPVDSLVLMNNMPKNLQNQVDSLRKLNSMKEADIIRDKLLIVLKMLDIHGFLDENLLGLNQYFQTNMQGPPFRNNTVTANYSSSYLYENTLVGDILMFSSFQRQVDKIDISPIIKQAIREGKAHPVIIKALVGYSTDEPCTMGKVLVMQLRLEDNINCPNKDWDIKKEKYYWKKEKSATLSEIEINERRQNLGLEKLEDAYRKAFFKSRPTPFLIYGGSYQAELAYIPNCELIDKMIKGAIVLR